MQHRQAIINLYRTMPGAPLPSSRENGFIRWDEIEGNDYWNFCAQIVLLIESSIKQQQHVNQFGTFSDG